MVVYVCFCVFMFLCFCVCVCLCVCVFVCVCGWVVGVMVCATYVPSLNLVLIASSDVLLFASQASLLLNAPCELVCKWLKVWWVRCLVIVIGSWYLLLALVGLCCMGRVGLWACGSVGGWVEKLCFGVGGCWGVLLAKCLGVLTTLMENMFGWLCVYAFGWFGVSWVMGLLLGYGLGWFGRLTC